MINEIQRFIGQVSQGVSLSREDTSRAFQIMLAGGATPAQIAALLMALRMKGETVAEITGAAQTLRAKMDKIDAPEDAIDVCGTGGDGKGTLNVSTAVALVVAGAGLAVVKHGNRSVSSQSGSADVLSALGVNVQTEKLLAEACLKEANICFLFAPLYHKALRHVMPVRQELGIRTIFNLLGPLCNPASPHYQLLGVYDAGLLMPMAETLKALGSRAAWIVHGSDGMDELTLSGPTQVAELSPDGIRSFQITPADAGLETVDSAELKGAGISHNAHELSLLLSGKRSAYRDVVLLNAAAALTIAGRTKNLRQGVEMAAQAIEDGKAKEALANLACITSAA